MGVHDGRVVQRAIYVQIVDFFGLGRATQVQISSTLLIFWTLKSTWRIQYIARQTREDDLTRTWRKPKWRVNSIKKNCDFISKLELKKNWIHFKEKDFIERKDDILHHQNTFKVNRQMVIVTLLKLVQISSVT